MPAASQAYQLVARVNPPARDIVRQATINYLDRTGMSPNDLAAEIGQLGGSSIRHFLGGTYEQVAENDAIIRAKLWDYFQRHPITLEDDDPPGKLLLTYDTRLILERIAQAKRNARIIVIEGPPGTSKTTVLKFYWLERNRQRHHDSFYFRAFHGITGVAFLRRLCRLLAANTGRSRDSLLRNAVRKLRQVRAKNSGAVLLVDEAQHLLYDRADAFEQLRDVIDLAGCGCVLAGHFNFLRALTDGFGRYLEQWLSRIDLHEHLRGLREEEVPELEKEWFGDYLPAPIHQQLIQFARVKDRNALFRSALLPEGTPRLPLRYLSIRRVRKFFERVEELRQIPGNANRPLPAIARAAIKLLMAPEGKAL